MSDYMFFTIDQYEEMAVLTLTEAAVTRVLQDGELRVELDAFLLTAKPRCVMVSFARLKRCPSSLIGGLIGLNKKLKERGNRLKLCDLAPSLREQFRRLSLDRVFEIHNSLSDAVAECDQLVVERATSVR